MFGLWNFLSGSWESYCDTPVERERFCVRGSLDTQRTNCLKKIPRPCSPSEILSANSKKPRDAYDISPQLTIFYFFTAPKQASLLQLPPLPQLPKFDLGNIGSELTKATSGGGNNPLAALGGSNNPLSGLVSGLTSGLGDAVKGVQTALKNPSGFVDKIVSGALDAIKKSIETAITFIKKTFSGDDQVSTTIRNVGVNGLTLVQNVLIQGAGNVTGILNKKLTPQAGLTNLASLFVDGIQNCVKTIVIGVGDLTGNPDLSKGLLSVIEEVTGLGKEIVEDIKAVTEGVPVGEVIGNIVDVIGKIIKVLVDGALRIIDGALTGSDAITKGVKYFIDNEAKIISNAVIDDLAAFGGTLKGKIEITEAVQNITTTTVKMIQKSIDTALQTIIQFLGSDSKLAQGIKSGISGAANSMLKAVSQPIDIINNVIDGLLTGSDPVTELVKTVVKGCLTGIKTIVNSVVTNGTGIVFGDVTLEDGVRNIAITGIDSVEKAFRTLFSIGEQLAEKSGNNVVAKAIENGLKTVDDTTAEVSKTLQGIATGEISIHDGIQSVFKSNIDLAQELINVVLAAISNALTGTDPISKTLKTIVDSGIESIQTSIKASLSALSDVTSGKTNIIDAMKSIGNTVISGLSNFIQAVTKAVSSLISGSDPLSASVKDLIELIGSTLSGIANNFAGAVSGKLSPVDAITKSITSVIAAVRSGAKIVQGLAQIGFESANKLRKDLENRGKTQMNMVLGNITELNQANITLFECIENILTGSVQNLKTLLIDLLNAIASLLTGSDPLSKLLHGVLIDGFKSVLDTTTDGFSNAVGIVGKTLEGQSNPLEALKEIVKIIIDSFNQSILASSAVVTDFQKFFDSLTTSQPESE